MSEILARTTIILSIAIGITSLVAGFGAAWYLYRGRGPDGIIEESQKLTSRIDYLERELQSARGTITKAHESAARSRAAIDDLIADNRRLETQLDQAENQNTELRGKLTDSQKLIESITTGAAGDTEIIDGTIDAIRAINEILGKYDSQLPSEDDTDRDG